MLERYYRELSSFCARILHSPELATDVVQASYAQVRAELPAQQISPRALLFATARRLMLTQFGSAKVSYNDSSHTVSACESVQHIMHTLQKLPRRRREAFLLHRFDGLSYAEIAQDMRISSAQVEQHIRLAMQACRQGLPAQYVVESSSRLV